MPSSEPKATDLRSLTLADMQALVVEMGLPKFRAEQLFRGVHGRAALDFEGLTDLPKDLRERLSSEVTLSKLDIDVEQVSVDGTRKLRLRTDDNRLIETVLIPDGDASAPDPDEPDDVQQQAMLDPAFGMPDAPRTRGGRPRWERRRDGNLQQRRPKMTQCVSSQVGCALDCQFCATATLGFGRNLTPGEIVEQVYMAERILQNLPEGDATRRAGADRVTNLVFMGMGEPLHNYANVVRALNILTDQRGRELSRRRVTFSTAGLVPAIEKLAEESLQPNLAVSLNAATDAVRDEIMPINRKWNIARLLQAVRKVAESPGYGKRRRVTFEYVLLDGVNDTDDDARKLVHLIRDIPSKVNLIPWNPHPGARYRRPSDARVMAFHRLLMERGVPVYVRRSRGDDIDAACGQLAAKGQPTPAESNAGSLVSLKTRPPAPSVS